MPEDERDPILFHRPDQPPGTITLWVMVRTVRTTGRDRPEVREQWHSKKRDLVIGSAEHLRYAVRIADRITSLDRERRKHRRTENA